MRDILFLSKIELFVKVFLPCTLLSEFLWIALICPFRCEKGQWL